MQSLVPGKMRRIFLTANYSINTNVVKVVNSDSWLYIDISESWKCIVVLIPMSIDTLAIVILLQALRASDKYMEKLDRHKKEKGVLREI